MAANDPIELSDSDVEWIPPPHGGNPVAAPNHSLYNLPPELMMMSMSHLDPSDMAPVARSSRYFRDLVGQPQVAREVMRKLPPARNPFIPLERPDLCTQPQYAVLCRWLSEFPFSHNSREANVWREGIHVALRAFLGLQPQPFSMVSVAGLARLPVNRQVHILDVWKHIRRLGTLQDKVAHDFHAFLLAHVGATVRPVLDPNVPLAAGTATAFADNPYHELAAEEPDNPFWYDMSSGKNRAPRAGHNLHGQPVPREAQGLPCQNLSVEQCAQRGQDCAPVPRFNDVQRRYGMVNAHITEGADEATRCLPIADVWHAIAEAKRKVTGIEEWGSGGPRKNMADVERAFAAKTAGGFGAAMLRQLRAGLEPYW
jgi:hypothetical protein